MGKGSLLKKLKTDLENHDQLRHQKKRKLDSVQEKAKKQHENKALKAIRQTFNPFDVKFNRTKSEIGRTAENARRAGAPSATKSNAEKERQQVYKAQKQIQNKVGQLVDRRIVRDQTLNPEEKLIQEYARERANRTKKNFSLEDEDDFEEYLHDDYEETEGANVQDESREFREFGESSNGGLKQADDDYTFDRNYFGPARSINGDINAENNAENNEEAPKERKKTKAEVMQEVIAKSKMYKAERQMQKSADEEMVDALNADFDDLLADLTAVETASKSKQRVVDEYDKNVTQLAFERRADPQDRTKTAEEIAKEEKEKLEREEQAKRSRMEGDDLDVPDDVHDDAEMFGLHASESDEEEVSEKEEVQVTGYAEVNVPTNLQELKLAASQTADLEQYLKSCIRKATPGRGSGDIKKLHLFSCALMEFSILSKPNFELGIKLLHSTAPNNEVAVVLGNHARDLVHRVKLRPVWKTKEVLLFALIGSLFSTSDQWHVVVTTAMLVMTSRLSQSVETSSETMSLNLVLCDLLLNFQRFSKRFIPEVPMYLLRLLAVFNPGVRELAGRFVRLSSTSLPTPSVPDTVDVQIDQKLEPGELVAVSAKLVQKSASMWRSLDAFPELYAPFDDAFKPFKDSSIVNESLNSLARLSTFSRKDRKFLELQQFKPIGIVSKTPLFDDNYNPEAKGYGQDPLKREQQKLRAQLKKERKGTLREIRRDTEFEARQQLNEKRTEMKEYHDKLKRLEGQINGEEGAERNAYERERSKKRKRHY